MTREQCHHIVAPTLMVALPCMGICRYAERAPLYLPEKYFGLGFHSLHILQITLQLQAILWHWNKPTVTSKLLWSSYEHWVVCVGSRFPFSLSTEVHKCLAPSNWWTSLAASVRQYLMDFKLISGLKPTQEDNFSINKQEMLIKQLDSFFSYLRQGGFLSSSVLNSISIIISSLMNLIFCSPTCSLATGICS